MSRTFVFERFDLMPDRADVSVEILELRAGDGAWVRADAAIDREAVLQAQIRTMETQLKEARLSLSDVRVLPAELTPPVRRILGMMLWETGPIAGALRAAGKHINNRAEDEQAAVLHWLLGFALEHGMNWEKPAAAALLKMTQGIKD